MYREVRNRETPPRKLPVPMMRSIFNIIAENDFDENKKVYAGVISFLKAV
jgi:hypothetical protein